MNNTQQAGNDSILVIGNKNIVFNFFKSKNCYKILSDIAKEIVENLDGSIEMDIDKIPAEIIEKIEYNNITMHKDEFIESSLYLDNVGYVIEKTYGKKSEVVINRIKYNWNKICALSPNDSKDVQLYRLNDILVEKVNSKIINKYGLESIEIGIGLIIFFVFTKCQILDNPN